MPGQMAHQMAHGEVEAQYRRGNLLASILGALEATGRDPEHIGPDDLMWMEEFHALGRMATIALADAAGIEEGDHVLDAGSGVGGPARTLVHNHGCRVTGVDATAEMCEVAQELDRRAGYADRIRIVQGDALSLPFRDGAFDVAWTQHVSMNIGDKGRFYRELRRAVRPGGRLAFFDVVAGANQPIHFPVPWAESQTQSFLAEPEEVRRLVVGAGFEIGLWDDVSEAATSFFQMLLAQPEALQNPVGMHLLMGDVGVKLANFGRNLGEGRVRALRAVAEASRAPGS